MGRHKGNARGHARGSSPGFLKQLQEELNGVSSQSTPDQTTPTEEKEESASQQ